MLQHRTAACLVQQQMETVIQFKYLFPVFSLDMKITQICDLIQIVKLLLRNIAARPLGTKPLQIRADLINIKNVLRGDAINVSSLVGNDRHKPLQLKLS